MNTITLISKTKFEVWHEMKDVYNKNHKDYCCVYDRDIITQDIKEELAKMRKSEIKLFEPHFINFGFKDEEKKYPIYHYLRSDIKILKNHLLLIEQYKNNAELYNDNRLEDRENDISKLKEENEKLKTKLKNNSVSNNMLKQYTLFIFRNSKSIIASIALTTFTLLFFIYQDMKQQFFINDDNGLKNNIIYKNYTKKDINEVESLVDENIK